MFGICLTTAPVAVLALADGSNSFLNISSLSGSIDAYVGDGASAEIHTGEGKTVQKCRLQLHHSLITPLYAGAVCVRVPSSLQAAVELSGTEVDLGPEVVLHGAQTNAASGQTTVTGEPVVSRWNTSPPLGSQRVDRLRTLRPHTRAHSCFL